MDNKGNTIQLIPSNEGITVIYHTYQSIDFGSTEVKYRLKLINGVPLIIFLFSDPNENFFVAVNFPELLQKGNSGWFQKVKIVFFLRRFEMPDTFDHKIPLRLELSISDSEEFKNNCLAQSGKSVEWIEATIDHIYDNDFKDYEWLY